MCGLLLINKPSGITSFGVVSRIKRLTGERHIGHTGTLDPMATGVLPVLIGRAARLSNYLICADKSYTAKIRLGIITDTLDITGKVLSEKKVLVTECEVDSVLKSFLGESMQIPPMFSAIKKDGVRLYSLARQGKEIDVPPRRITVFSASRQSGINENAEFTADFNVSKGTYIRSLVRDIGEKLGTGAVLTSLVRTKTAGFCIDECVDLENLTEENISEYILPAENAVAYFNKATVTRAQAFRFSNGGSLSFERLKNSKFSEGEIVRVYFEDEFLGLAEAISDKKELKFKCLINDLKGE